MPLSDLAFQCLVQREWAFSLVCEFNQYLDVVLPNKHATLDDATRFMPEFFAAKAADAQNELVKEHEIVVQKHDSMLSTLMKIAYSKAPDDLRVKALEEELQVSNVANKVLEAQLKSANNRLDQYERQLKQFYSLPAAIQGERYEIEEEDYKWLKSQMVEDDRIGFLKEVGLVPQHF